MPNWVTAIERLAIDPESLKVSAERKSSISPLVEPTGETLMGFICHLSIDYVYFVLAFAFVSVYVSVRVSEYVCMCTRADFKPT